MSVKGIQLNQPDKNVYSQKSANNVSNSPSFTGMGNPVVTLMDAIDRGGFAASFIAQDGIGMVSPRIYEGINRNRDKTGEYNWDFARREGIREILSGPSAFIIPAIMLAYIKKASGSANNVSVDMINALGGHFATYAAANKESLKDAAKAKEEFYNNIFKNVLKNSTEQKLADDEVERLAKHFTQKTIEIEKAQSKGFFKNLVGTPVKGSAEDLRQALADEFVELRKSNVDASADFTGAVVKSQDGKTLSTSFKKMLDSMRDYTTDAVEKTSKAITNSTDDITDIVKNFNKKRVGTRVLTNLSMFSAVVAFYTIIPKLYSLGLKGNPGLNGLQEDSDAKTKDNKDNKDNTDKTNNSQPSFTGRANLFTKTAETVNGSKFWKGVSDKFEFNGPSMPVSAMLTLLFGFCLPPRYLNAKDENGKPDVHDRKEILVRDVSSFTAILFGAKALSRGFSDVCAKFSGFALNTKPADNDKSIFHKAKNYFTAGAGVDVLNSETIVSKYSNIDKYNGGINGFFDFLKKNGGDVKKVLAFDETVKANAEKIIGKSIKDATVEEIETAFKQVKDKDALENIYKVFKDSNNNFIKRAKALNSAFGFVSMLVLVPAFMMWLAKYCENMTKEAVAKERAAKEAQNIADVKQAVAQNPSLAMVNQKQPTMSGFLAEKKM